MLGQQAASLAYIDIIQIFSIASFLRYTDCLIGEARQTGAGAAMGH